MILFYQEPLPFELSSEFTKDALSVNLSLEDEKDNTDARAKAKKSTGNLLTYFLYRKGRGNNKGFLEGCR